MHYVYTAVIFFFIGVIFARVLWASAIAKGREAEGWAKGEIAKVPAWLASKLSSLK